MEILGYQVTWLISRTTSHGIRVNGKS